MGGERARQLARGPDRAAARRACSAPDAPGFAYTPAFSPDGRLIAYSRWKPGGFRDIHLYDLDAGTDRALTVDRAMDVDPRFTPDGRYLLLSSDRTGIYDVYAYELATGAALSGDQRADRARSSRSSRPTARQLVYTGFTIDGFDLYAMPFDPTSFRLAQPFANARPDAPPILDADSDSPDAVVGRRRRRRSISARPATSPGSTCTRGPGSSASTRDALGLGSAGFVSTTIADPVGNHTCRRQPAAPARRRPSVDVGYSYTAACSRRSTCRFRRTAQQRAGPDHRRRQHALPAARARRHARRRA